MNEQLLNMMRQWLEQLEQGQDGADPSRYWQQLQAQLSQATPAGQTTLQADLLHRITRQNEHFRLFAADLIQLCDKDQRIELNQLLDSFRRHLDQLNLDWVMSSWPLPEQLTATLTLLSRQDSPMHASLQQFNQLLQQLLGSLEPHLLPSLVEQLRAFLHQLEAFELAREHYLHQLSQINGEALDKFSQVLSNSTISDLEQLHQLWINCYEERYQIRLTQHDYQQAFGSLCNAAMALRQSWQEQLEQLYSRCGLVTLSQYDELSRQHHELRRRVRALERQQDSVTPDQASHPKDSNDAH